MIKVKMDKQSLTDGLIDCHLVHFRYKICLITALFWEKHIGNFQKKVETDELPWIVRI